MLGNGSLKVMEEKLCPDHGNSSRKNVTLPGTCSLSPGRNHGGGSLNLTPLQLIVIPHQRARLYTLLGRYRVPGMATKETMITNNPAPVRIADNARTDFRVRSRFMTANCCLQALGFFCKSPLCNEASLHTDGVAGKSSAAPGVPCPGLEVSWTRRARRG